MSPYVVRSPWTAMMQSGQSSFGRDQAWALVTEFVKNPNLQKHMLACEAAMRAYAAKYGGNVDEWGLVGLLHDFDWELHPTLEQHPQAGQSILQERGVPESIRQAIMAHAPHTGVIPTNDMERCILAVDELTGLIVACALVTPTKKLGEVTVPGVIKKLKEKSFAARVSRDDIRRGIELLQTTMEEHIRMVLTAMQSIHEQLGL